MYEAKIATLIRIADVDPTTQDVGLQRVLLNKRSPLTHDTNAEADFVTASTGVSSITMFTLNTIIISMLVPLLSTAVVGFLLRN